MIILFKKLDYENIWTNVVHLENSVLKLIISYNSVFDSYFGASFALILIITP